MGAMVRNGIFTGCCDTRAMRATAVVVAYNSGEALTRCLDSLAGEDVVVVNNGAHGPEIEDAAGRVRVIESDNRRLRRRMQPGRARG